MSNQSQVNEVYSPSYEDEKRIDDTKSITSEERQHEEDTTPEMKLAEKSLLRKLDYIYVMPCVAILNFLQV